MNIQVLPVGGIKEKIIAVSVFEVMVLVVSSFDFLFGDYLINYPLPLNWLVGFSDCDINKFVCFVVKLFTTR